MPPGTTIQKFIDALKTGKTNTTKVLDLLGTAANLATYTTATWTDGITIATHLATVGALNALTTVPSVGHLPDWAEAELINKAGAAIPPLTLTPDELLHIGRWPDPEKEKVRIALYKAITNGLNVHFFWEIYYDGGTDTQIIDPDTTGGITIKFRSPAANIRLTQVAGADDITVDVP